MNSLSRGEAEMAGKSHLKLVTPATVKRTVTPTRLPNDDLRTREYLTEAEIERLMNAAKHNRWARRDATMIVLDLSHIQWLTIANATKSRSWPGTACEKYAWVAQHEGLVLRKNPLKQAPLKDWVYKRIAKADFGIPYIDKSGHKKLWYPDLPTMLAAYYEPQYAGDILYHQDFLIAERIGLPARLAGV